MHLKIIRLIFVSLFLSLAFSLVFIQLIQGTYYYNLSTNNRIRVMPIEGRRGQIFDRNGVAIADSRVSFDVAVIPQEVKDQEELLEYVSGVLQKDREDLARTFKKRIQAPFEPVVIAEDIRRETAIVLEENKFRFPGLIIKVSSRRYYPFGFVNAHLLGYLGKIDRSSLTQLKDYGYTIQSVIGYSGIEKYYDAYLKGEVGGLQIEVDHRGQQVRLLSLREPTKGEDVVLTIDNRIQTMATEALSGHRGAIVMMDLDSGEILGMVSAPSFDPNLLTSGKVGNIFFDSSAPLLNRAISGLYPPGSVFKVPVAVGALQTGKINPHTSFLCNGSYHLGNRQFECAHTHNIQDLNQALAHSCNVYFFNTGLILGPELMAKYARMLGLGALTNVDIPYEATGLVPDRTQKKISRRQYWYQGDTLNFSIGQGDVLVTPLQLVSMMSIVANDGEAIQPHLLKAVGRQNYVLSQHQPRIPVGKKIYEIVKNGLKAAVEDQEGTARLLDIEGLQVLGKTGTAQTSGGRPNHAWFVGFCPSAKTKIVFCVFLEHGGWSTNACEVTKELLLRMMKEKIL